MFLAQGHEVHWLTEGGSYPLPGYMIETLLRFFDEQGCESAWDELDRAAQAAGYPPSVSSLRRAAVAEARGKRDAYLRRVRDGDLRATAERVSGLRKAAA